jgi:integrase
MSRNSLPRNTRIKDGFIEFRKQYKGTSICRAWPERQKEIAIREIYDLLHRMSRNDDLLIQTEHRMMVEEMIDTFLKIHGPSLKGGISEASRSQYRLLRSQLDQVKKAWAGKFSDTITKYDVRDFLSKYDNVGTVMKYLGILTTMFKKFEEWNEDGNILKVRVKLPKHNPATKWRKEMKPHQKKELPRTRVLSPSEWGKFKLHLSSRARNICEIALRRFLRLSDIKQISYLSIKGDIIEGIQSKTGEKFTIPTMGSQPVSYDFTNFKREFKKAQVAAGMDYPIIHPLHFTSRDLRRTGSTWAYKLTKDLVGISKMLGHRKITTTIRYLNIDDTDKLAIAQAVDELSKSYESATPDTLAQLAQLVEYPLDMGKVTGSSPVLGTTFSEVGGKLGRKSSEGV